ncbi:MAG: hypothetical protein NTV54_01835 [Ignavibacteriales bacterium]|nr:hypothetical protein [Ignavibacteriales bacterium]
MGNNTAIFLLFIFSFFLSFMWVGCSKDSPTAPPQEVPPPATGVYVLNEGVMGKGNASLSFYVPDSNKVYPDVFSSVNKRGLGDTGNDIVLYKGRVYIVVQQSQKIEVISSTDQKSIGTIQLQGVKSPAKICILNDAKGYVTNLYDRSVTVFNPTTLEIIKERIPVGSYPSGLTAASNKIYVCNSGWGADSTVSVIDAATDQVVKTIVVRRQPSEIVLTSKGELVVKCDGYMDWSNAANNLPGWLVIIDPARDTSVASFQIPLSKYGNPGHMAISSTGKGFVKTSPGILTFQANTRMLDSTLVVVSPTVYSFGWDDAAERLYVTDARDYSSIGDVTIYDSRGSKQTSFSAGIIPGTLAFKR